MAVNTPAFSIPDPAISGEKTLLRRPISAIQLTQAEDGSVKLGTLSQLPPGVLVERCGVGFTDRTVKVRTRQACYFVFLQDLETQSTN